MNEKPQLLPECPFGKGKCGTCCSNHGLAVHVERLNGMMPVDIRARVEASRDQQSIKDTANGICVGLGKCNNTP